MSVQATHSIALIPGDGIGVDVTDAALAVLEAAAPDVRFATERFPWGCEYQLRTGRMMDPDGLERLRAFDAILFGACGWPTVPDHVSLWGLRLAICQGFDQAVCLRPARLLPGVPQRLAADAPPIDVVVVRENTEGEYSGVGGRSHAGADEIALQTTVYTRRAIERVVRYACELASTRPARHLISVTKSNASQHACVLWDEVAAAVAADFPELRFESVLVDAMAARLVLAPGSVDVLVASNLHGDILSDLTGALAGSLGMVPSGNLVIDGSAPSMFEPVHGSAPDIAGRGIANPVGAILSAAMMAESLGLADAAARIRAAVEAACLAGVRTRDVGGTATTSEVTREIVGALE